MENPIILERDMAVILICGAPGTGKTTLAYRLADRLQVDHIIQSDTVKDFFEIFDLNEIACGASHDVWKHFGEKDRETIVKGFREHVKYYRKIISELIRQENRKFEVVIAEGVQVTPSLFDSISKIDKIGFLLRIGDQEEQVRRYRQKNRMRRKLNRKWFENYDAIEIIDSYLVEQAKSLNSDDLHIMGEDSFEKTLDKVHEISSKKLRNYAV